MCSSPEMLPLENSLDLAIKFSTWPPAYWLHTKAEIGSQVTMRVGGDFHYPNPVTDALGGQGHNLLLVAGGVGINPLASIYRHAARNSHDLNLSQASLLYSAKSVEELIFKGDLDSISSDNEKLKVKYFITKQDDDDQVDPNEAVSLGRINTDDLRRSLEAFGNGLPTFCYICGPTSMIQDISNQLQSLGVPKPHVFYELWW